MRESSPASPSLVASAFLLVLTASADARGNPSCPPPSVPLGGQCVLQGDSQIAETMWLPSGTHLNCRGRRLTPAVAGTWDDPRTPANEFLPSQPELALFVDGAHDVKIQNCVLSGFDFGIIVARSKSGDAPPGEGPPRTKIQGNTIEVRTNAIDVIKSDRVLIHGNTVTYHAERGRGIVVDYDSDGNEIRGNTVVSTGEASTGAVRQLPLGPFVTNTAIMDNEIHCLHADRAVQNLVVNGVLVQVTAADSAPDFEDSSRSEDNVIEANEILDLGTGSSCALDPGTACRANAECAGKGVCLLRQNSGVAFNNRATRTLVRGNRFSGRMERGVSAGGSPVVLPIPDWYPGTCTGDGTRRCSTDADCNIAGFDTADLGSCVGVRPLTIDGNSVDLAVEDNVLDGVFDTAGLFANNTDRFVFRRNTIRGGVSGIRIVATAIHGLIERNVVSGASNALHLGFQSPWTNVTRLNDFSGYDRAIRTSNDFRTATDLSDEFGNYWGLPCPGFDPGLVVFDDGAPNPYVTDGRPYGEPVAATAEDALPAPCP